MEIRNHGKQNLDLRPQDIQLQITRPGVRNISSIPAHEVAKKLIDSENSRAFSIEAAGAVATRTVVEHVPVTEVKHNPASVNDPAQPAVTVETRIDVVHRTAPDDHARLAASAQASHIRLRAKADGKQILKTVFSATSPTPNSQATGRLYYVREKRAREVLLRMPLADLIVEIPFTVISRSGFLAPTTIKFE